ncbi:hypothetical protein TNCV_4300341 [Trichonephila clavipes]|nr:hypothetical protein TNCV_4300341 [Trichonephila clavipes]
MLEKVIENWMSRLDYIRASRDSHMPEIIFKMLQYLPLRGMRPYLKNCSQVTDTGLVLKLISPPPTPPEVPALQPALPITKKLFM